MEPWLVNPELTPNRIERIAKTLVGVRENLSRKIPGEIMAARWGAGCLAYELSVNAMEVLATESPWLTIDRSGLQFSFFVGGQLIKFYRGDDEPGARRLKVAAKEMQLGLGFSDGAEGWSWFFQLDTDESGTVERVTVMQAHEDGTTQHHYDVPLLAKVIPMERPAVEIPPAPLALHEEESGEVDKSPNED